MNPATSLANDPLPPTCDEALTACGLAIKDLREERTLLYKQLSDKNNRITALESQVSSTPWIYYVLGGVIMTLVGQRVLK